MQVFKFGGASIQNAASIQQLEQIIKAKYTCPLVIVVSALGKTTSSLEDIFYQNLAKKSYTQTLHRLYQFHQTIIDQLLTTLRQAAHQTLMLWQQQLTATLSLPITDTTLDMRYSSVVATGELLASKLIDYYLKEKHWTCAWLDARAYIKTKEDYFCNAPVDWITTQNLVKKLRPSLHKKSLLLTQGFISSNTAGETTTLGKEGSDFTGAILATTLKAQSLTIWKDVPGIMHADPNLFKKATKFEQISYHTVEKMAFYGAKIIHPQTIHPLATHNIPLYVKPFYCPHETGTIVKQESIQLNAPVCIIQDNQLLLQITSLDRFKVFNQEQLQDILHQLGQQKFCINMLVSNPYKMLVCVNNNLYKLPQLLAALSHRYKVNNHIQVKLLTILHQEIHLLQQWQQKKDSALLTQQRPGIYQAVCSKSVMTPYGYLP
ncbi:MAG: hypothetical protein HKP45_02095 [Winogradskyella sp.]|nr:hypothetical protein [Winogradskyella sp.]